MNAKAQVAPPFVSPSPTAEQPQALIGSKIRIKGELYGEEDILVQGQVEGTIEVKDNSLTIGTEGRVHADSKATQITVEGQVKGDLSGDQKVVIKASSSVVGNVNAPRVSLEDGARFKGMIDMSSTPPASSKDVMG